MEERSSRASRWPSSTASPRSTSARTAASRHSRATAAIPAAIVHLAERDGRPRHPRRVRAARRATSSRSTSASRRTAWSPTRRATFAVGEISAEAQRLLDVCQAALEAGIEQARAGQPASATSPHAVQSDDRGGRLLGRPQPRRPRRRPLYHEDPQIPNFVSSYRGPGAARGHDARDRADDHRRRPGRLRARRRAGRSRPTTARSRPISSTPSRSPRAPGADEPRGPGTMTVRGGAVLCSSTG